MFISFEGGEGAGKSTLIDLVETLLMAGNRDVVKTREPGGTVLGEKIRSFLLNKDVTPVPMAELLLFLAARAQQIEEVIKPALSLGKIVLCDRFHDSTIAYQGGARGLGFEKVQRLCLETCGHFLPDLTFYLDVDPKIGIFRSLRRGEELDRLESEDLFFHEIVRDAFLLIAKNDPDRFYQIDASQPQEEVFAKVSSLLLKKL